MYTLIKSLREKCSVIVKALFPDIDLTILSITPATQERFGHYQWNDSLKMAGILKKSPRDIAQLLVSQLQLDPVFEKIEIAGPGFINIVFSLDFLGDYLKELIKGLHFQGFRTNKPEKIIVEFSSPNIAKEMHVGHLRSTIIGDALARIFEFGGHDVLRLNHIGDWGTAFGMLITYIFRYEPTLPDNPEVLTLTYLSTIYKKSKTCFDSDPLFKQAARKAVVALQAHEDKYIKIWQLICDVSRKAFEEIYLKLDVKLIERGESFYNPFLPSIIQDLEDKNLICISDGAKCVFHEGFSIPLMMQKSDGGYNYDTTDVAAMLYRSQTDLAQRIIILTDAGQALHFALVEKTAQAAGYLNNVHFHHVPFGVVTDSDGKKFRSRSGETIKLSELLDEAIEEASRILIEKKQNKALVNEEKSSPLTTISPETLGINAIKYADLSCKRTSDYAFSFEKMLRFEGNTASFILYSYVRIKGIQRKKNLSDEALQALSNNYTPIPEHPSEITLVLHLLRFPEILEKIQEELYPHYLTDYLYELAHKFNAFFRDCRVADSENEHTRLVFCYITAEIFKTGMELLGLKVCDYL
ncbi:arginine--tRNA ligase [Candidatus Clavichlamydia salmonicola]|uniref:arginine--tRNA ligase n=1 Tax=Candidatus Clavichlamydia salmonicola TaxID=469812 RepID=UPI00189103B6|nr:arginine--tRNA ligase [Candidatus Clavichlamydia salmonicola]